MNIRNLRYPKGRYIFPIAEYKSEHWAYNGAIMRCVNPKSKAFKNYGGRGIQFLYSSFDEFMFDLGSKPTNEYYSLDRINNAGNYEVGNCKWSTRKEQNQNRRNCRLTPVDRANIFLLQGLMQIKDVMQKYGVSYAIVWKIWRNQVNK